MNQNKKPRKKGSALFNLLLIFFLTVFAVSAWFVVSYFLDSRQQESRYDELAAMVEAAKKTASESTVPDLPPQPTVPENTVPPSETAPTEPPETEPVILPEYAPIYELNTDMVGWISIEGTRIDYPVMQSRDDPDFYLYRNFDRQHNLRGCIYADEDCDIFTPSDNITLYGHHMRDGSMFADLKFFNYPTFRDEHPYIQFDTLTEHHTYEIFAVFSLSVTKSGSFRYHSFTDAKDQADFDRFIAQCLELSLYDTGIVPEYGDKIICLSTCEYTHRNGRLVVAAVRTD